MNEQNHWKYKMIIGGVSALIPVVVGILLYLPSIFRFESFNPFLLPKLNAFINSTVTICLILAVVAIKKGNVSLHKKLMFSAFVLSAIFLVSYILYHAQGIEVKYGDLNGDGIADANEKLQAGAARLIYFFILLTHILLSVAVVPLVLMSLYYALTEQLSKHKKMVRWAFPIWLYVSVTGVLVYLLISPFYQFVTI